MSLRLLVLFVALCLAACAPRAVCSETRDDVRGLDGGVWRCARAEDCPRDSNSVVCETDALAQVPCVSCTASTCLRHSPVLCE